ncbi:MAG: CBS domain-containing protein [Candidatus Micrarchaeota archaeon]
MLFELSEIRRMRESAGLTQKTLSRQSGVSQPTIAKIEGGKTDPAYSKAKAIFEALESARKEGENSASSIMNRRIFSVRGGQKVIEGIRIMKREGISQLLILDGHGHPTGSLTEKGIISRMEEESAFNPSKSRISEISEEAFPTIAKNTTQTTIRHILRDSQAVVVMQGNGILGIITKADLLGKI